MLITFSAREYRDIIMFGEVGLALLKAMGMSGRVPGAMDAEEVPAALAALEAYLDRAGNAPAPAPGEEDEGEGEDKVKSVSLRQRALPLLDMLRACQGQGCGIMWR